MKTATAADFEAINQGSIVQVIAHSEAAVDWINENVAAPSYMWNGTVLNIEFRYAHTIVQAMLDEGLTTEKETADHA